MSESTKHQVPVTRDAREAKFDAWDVISWREHPDAMPDAARPDAIRTSISGVAGAVVAGVIDYCKNL